MKICTRCQSYKLETKTYKECDMEGIESLTDYVTEEYHRCLSQINPITGKVDINDCVRFNKDGKCSYYKEIA